MHFTYFVILNASLFAKVELPKIAISLSSRFTRYNVFLQLSNAICLRHPYNTLQLSYTCHKGFKRVLKILATVVAV